HEGPNVFPLSIADSLPKPDFNPVILQQQRETGIVPRHLLSISLELRPEFGCKLAEWQCHIKRVFLGPKTSWPRTISDVGVINSTKVQLPFLIPIALIIRDKAIVVIRGFAHPKQGGDG